MIIFSFTCNAFGKPKYSCPDDRQKKQQQKTEGSDWRSAYDTTRAARRSVRDGWSIASVTRSGGLADDCVLLAVPTACQIAVVFATYLDSEAANLLESL